LLRKRPKAPVDGECNKDDRKAVDETVCGRKSAGILVAVTPCLQIAAVTPLFASESITQVVLFVISVMGLFQDSMPGLAVLMLSFNNFEPRYGA
jgi:hypothetical protein